MITTGVHRVWLDAVQLKENEMPVKPTYEELLASLAWIVTFCQEHGEWFEIEENNAEQEWLANADQLVRHAELP